MESTHWPPALHCPGLAQLPQLPVQPSEPQFLPAQLGVQTHAPLLLHDQALPRTEHELPEHRHAVPVALHVGVDSPELMQLPQVPPQPSGPHTLPLHWGMHWH